MFIFPYLCRLYTFRVSNGSNECKNKSLYILLMIIEIFMYVYVWRLNLSLDRLSQDQKKGKVNFWKEPQRRPYTIINFPCSQNCHSLYSFSQFWQPRESSRVDRWLSWSRRRNSRRPLMYRRKFRQVRNGFEPMQVKMTHFQTLPTCSLTAYPSKLSCDSQNWGSFNPRSRVVQ